MGELCHIQEDAFSVRADAARKLLDIELRGFWDLGTIDRFAGAVAMALQTLKSAGCRPGEQVSLVDNAQLNIQSQDVVHRFEELIESRLNTSRRTAVIVSSALLKMQAKRVGPSHQIFEDRDTALRWLLETAE